FLAAVVSMQVIPSGYYVERPSVCLCGKSRRRERSMAQANTTSVTVSPNETVGIGCIGVGGRGQGLLRSLLEVPGGAVRPVSDINPQNSAKAKAIVVEAGHPAPDEIADWRRLLERKDIEGIVSALPCDLHAQNYREVISAGKDLYAEKPMCLTVADCNAV